MLEQTPEGKARMTLSLPADLKAQFEAAVPPRQRSAFTAQAIKAALKEQAKKKLFDMLDNLPAYDTKGVSSLEVQRRFRREMDGRANLD